MKKFSTGLLTGLLIGLLLAGSTFAFAGDAIKLIVNGKEIACDVAPQAINGRVMVPAKYVAESLGATVSWDATNNAVVVNGAGYVAPVQSTVQSTSNTDKQEFLALSSEADAMIQKYGERVNSSISESERENINADIKTFQMKLSTWGELYPYTAIKNLYITSLTDLQLCCLYRSTINVKYLEEKSATNFEKYYSGFEIDKTKIQAEKTRLQKLGY